MISGGNPYAPPKAYPLAAAEGSGSPAHATFRLVAWIFWALLVLSFMWDLSGRLFRDVAGPNPSGTDNLLPHLLVAAVQSAMVVFMRWIVFTYMTRKMNPAGWGAAVHGVSPRF